MSTPLPTPSRKERTNGSRYMFAPLAPPSYTPAGASGRETGDGEHGGLYHAVTLFSARIHPCATPRGAGGHLRDACDARLVRPLRCRDQASAPVVRPCMSIRASCQPCWRGLWATGGNRRARQPERATTPPLAFSLHGDEVVKEGKVTGRMRGGRFFSVGFFELTTEGFLLLFHSLAVFIHWHVSETPDWM